MVDKVYELIKSNLKALASTLLTMSNQLAMATRDYAARNGAAFHSCLGQRSTLSNGSNSSLGSTISSSSTVRPSLTKGGNAATMLSRVAKDSKDMTTNIQFTVCALNSTEHQTDRTCLRVGGHGEEVSRANCCCFCLVGAPSRHGLRMPSALFFLTSLNALLFLDRTYSYIAKRCKTTQNVFHLLEVPFFSILLPEADGWRLH